MGCSDLKKFSKLKFTRTHINPMLTYERGKTSQFALLLYIFRNSSSKLDLPEAWLRVNGDALRRPRWWQTISLYPTQSSLTKKLNPNQFTIKVEANLQHKVLPRQKKPSLRYPQAIWMEQESGVVGEVLSDQNNSKGRHIPYKIRPSSERANLPHKFGQAGPPSDAGAFLRRTRAHVGWNDKQRCCSSRNMYKLSLTKKSRPAEPRNQCIRAQKRLGAGKKRPPFCPGFLRIPEFFPPRVWWIPSPQDSGFRVLGFTRILKC